MERFGRLVASWIFAAFVLFLWLTNRKRYVNDPRPRLRCEKIGYVYAGLHAHQVAGVIAGESGATVMISRSADGDLVIPSLLVRGIHAVRGSTRTGCKKKGGSAALEKLVAVAAAGKPVSFTVDGPRGPRGYVRRGVADLATRCGGTVLPLVVIPSRRLVLSRTWDRFQVPGPFGTITMVFGEPIVRRPDESLTDLRVRIGRAIDALEWHHDAEEAARATKLCCSREEQRHSGASA